MTGSPCTASEMNGCGRSEKVEICLFISPVSNRPMDLVTRFFEHCAGFISVSFSENCTHLCFVLFLMWISSVIQAVSDIILVAGE